MEKKLNIVFENENLLVVNKEAGMTTTKERKGEKGTLEDLLVEVNGKNDLARQGIVHRLDKGTSGLILVAKNELSLDNLKSQFKERKVTKKYICLVEGNSSGDGEIKVPIGRSRFFSKFKVVDDGKESLTEFKKIGDYKKEDKKYSLLEVNLKTGRSHQIRVHMGYLGWPLLGDKLYGGSNKDLKRPFLQAKFISFKEPVSGKKLSFESELAEDLKKSLSSYEKVKE
jgi:23S rRNA pseudouridine1911/1915/1917 synthase